MMLFVPYYAVIALCIVACVVGSVAAYYIFEGLWRPVLFVVFVYSSAVMFMVASVVMRCC